MRDPCSDGKILYVCININILDVTLHYSFARCYHWGTLDKGYTEICLYYFLQLHVNLQLSEYKKFN